ncbi:MAG: hypothetical protein O3B01_31605 [Planctomycetota bacterium]|nr:hypothetical protein [Planctomycetota bacterium]MDA1143130.1 hypothetical protein [Planctomycetota bacterium]
MTTGSQHERMNRISGPPRILSIAISTLVLATIVSPNAMAKAKTKDFPDYPKKAIQWTATDKVDKGRYGECKLTVNTDGSFKGDWKYENMVALAGCHIAGRLEFRDAKGNILALVKMPRMGLKAAGLSKRVERHKAFSGTIKLENVDKLHTLYFNAFEDADGTLSKDIKEVTDFFKKLVNE